MSWPPVLAVPIDHYGIQQYLAPNGEVCSVPLYKLIGDSFGLSALDTAMWVPTTGTGGTVAPVDGVLQLNTGTTSGNAVSCVSAHVARFSGLAPNKIRIPLQLPDAGVAGNVRRWGIRIGTTDGAYFSMDGTTFKCVTLKNSVESPISSGAFNGQWGKSFVPGTSSHFYEIIYQPRQVMFLADNKIIHTLNAAASQWTRTLHLSILLENANSAGVTTDVGMGVRLATVARFGIPEVQNVGDFSTGLQTGKVLKVGPGNLEQIVLSAIGNNADITLYDNIAASGRVIWNSGPMPSNSVPLPIPMGGELFSIGLTLVVATASAQVKTVFN